MPRYYYQAVTAVELPDDIFGCLPEFAIMITKHCLLFTPDTDFDQALLCAAVCFHSTISSVSAVCQFLTEEKEKKKVNCLFV